MKKILLASGFVLLGLAGCQSNGASSPDNNWYTRLVGAAGDGADNQLQINGFSQVDRFESGANSYGTVWYNQSTNQCLQVITVSGRVDSALDIQTHPNCNSAGIASGSGTIGGSPAVGSETDLTAFQGARAGQAEGGIRNLGYEPIRSQGLTTYWFNRSTGACARIDTADGRYSSVTMLPAEDC